MVKQRIKSGSLVFVLFLVFSFGTGIILVTASQQNTEGRSKAAPYSSITPKTSPTPSVNPWDDCMSWDPENNCVDTYRTYKAKRDADWRCKPLFSGYGLCEPAVEYPPGNP